MRHRLIRWLIQSLAGLLAVAGCTQSPAQLQTIALFTTLPILWQEADDLRGLLGSDAPEHWALPVLRAQGEVRALNTLTADPDPLAGIGLLVMAQPRALAPQENVALDQWVRRGGRVLLFADPMLTADSRFALGDKRRPQDVALLSPILARWGLRLEFDEGEAAGERGAALFGAQLPVNLPGRLALTEVGGRCRLLSERIAAQCRIGRGRALIIADAALFEPVEENEADRRRELLRLLLEAA